MFILQPKEDVQTVENDADDTDAPSEKKAKLDKGEVCGNVKCAVCM